MSDGVAKALMLSVEKKEQMESKIMEVHNVGSIREILV
jgi:hypothetical protein